MEKNIPLYYKLIFIISNTCVGSSVIRHLGIFPYNNPFISTFIPNDEHFNKLANNFIEYINMEPLLGEPSETSIFALQNNSKWYKNTSVPIPYPVLYIGDIEIHCIHDRDLNECLNKFMRRLIRTRNIINEGNYHIYFILSFSELINDNENIEQYIDNFLEYNCEYIQKFFIGPEKYMKDFKNYIPINEWNNIELKRDDSNVYIFNDQTFNTNKFLEIFHK